VLLGLIWISFVYCCCCCCLKKMREGSLKNLL
jgi:hypothetical protein